MCDRVSTLGEGTYGSVYQYQIKSTGEKYAVKIASSNPVTTAELREISCVKALKHPNVIEFLAVGFDKQDQIYAAMEMGITLTTAIRSFNTPKFLKSYAYQLLVGVDYCLARNVLHRDLKPANLIYFRDGTLKIADFGLARALSCVDGTGQTREVVTLWYRSPELLLGGKYGDGLDKWSVACILYEIYSGSALFRGNDEMDQINKIFEAMGDPGKEFADMPYWKAVNIRPTSKSDPLAKIKVPEIKKMIGELLTYAPEKRPSLKSLYSTKFFDEVRVSENENYKWYGCIENLEQRVFKGGKFFEGLPLQRQRDVKELIYGNVDYYDLSPGSYFYAIDLMSVVGKDGENIGILALSCLWLATLQRELQPLALEDLKEDSISTDKIQSKGEVVLELIEFDTLRSTCYDFYKEFRRFYPNLTGQHGVKLMYYFSLSGKYHTIKPKTVAMAAIFMECTYQRRQFIHFTSEGQIDSMLALVSFLNSKTIKLDANTEAHVKSVTNSKMWKY